MHITVIGSGQMGAGIAQVCASGGHDVMLYDADGAALARAREGIQRRLERSVAKGVISSDLAAAAAQAISYEADLHACVKPTPRCIIEAIPENFALKASLFAQLDTIVDAQTIFATNTSSISITALAALTKRPERVVGMHFMNPVPVMELVEIVRGERTTADTIATVHELARQLGKKPVIVDDQPGFVANRILMPMINEAIYALADGVADTRGIDTVMTLGMNHPMGPLTLADFIGLDTCLAILEVLQHGYGDPKYRPAPLLRRMVTAGRVGRKVREGFYHYNERGEQGEPIRASGQPE